MTTTKNTMLLLSNTKTGEETVLAVVPPLTKDLIMLKFTNRTAINADLRPVARQQRTMGALAFCCQECGRKFRTAVAAERATNHGCPGCGGTDIDLDTGVSR